MSPSAATTFTDTFNAELLRVGKRVGAFLHERINAGEDINAPANPSALPLTVYELGFVLEAIESYLERERMKALGPRGAAR